MSKIAVATLPGAGLGALVLLPFFLHHQMVVMCQGHVRPGTWHSPGPRFGRSVSHPQEGGRSTGCSALSMPKGCQSEQEGVGAGRGRPSANWISLSCHQTAALAGGHQ